MKKILLFVFLSFFAFNSCEEESNPVTSEEVIVPNEGTKVLSEEITNQLVTTNLSQDSLYFNGDVNDLKVNDIIISDVDEGILRKVISIQKVGSQTLVLTDTTSLADAFQQIAFDDSFDITEDDIESIQYHIPGVKLLKTNNPTGLSFGIEDLVLYDKDGNPSTKNDQVKGSGSFTLGLKPSFKLKIDHGLKYFKAAIKPTGTIEINTEAHWSGAFNVKIKVATLKMKKITLWVGWVPVVIKTTIPIYLGAEGDIDGTVKLDIKNETSITFGGEFQNNSFNFISNASNTFTFTSPSITGEASLKYYIEPRVSFKVYGAAGPELRFNIYLLGEGEANTNSVSAKLYAGLDATVAMVVKVFGYKISKESDPLFGTKILLHQWENPLGGTPPTVTTDQFSVDGPDAYGGGNVADEGSASVTAKGVCWSTSQNPTISNNKTNDGEGPGPFSSIIHGLSPSTTYYVRAYATSSAGTGYGNQVSFTTY